MIEPVDREDRLRPPLPKPDAMAGDGLITLERPEILACRSRRTDGAEPNARPGEREEDR